MSIILFSYFVLLCVVIYNALTNLNFHIYMFSKVTEDYINNYMETSETEAAKRILMNRSGKSEYITFKILKECKILLGVISDPNTIEKIKDIQRYVLNTSSYYDGTYVTYSDLESVWEKIKKLKCGHSKLKKFNTLNKRCSLDTLEEIKSNVLRSNLKNLKSELLPLRDELKNVEDIRSYYDILKDINERIESLESGKNKLIQPKEKLDFAKRYLDGLEDW